MNSNYLLSHKYKKIGWILFSIGFILGLVYLFIEEEPKFLDGYMFAVLSKGLTSHGNYFFKVVETNLFNEIIAALLIVGGLFASFSKEKIEDEFIAKNRLESLVWAVIVNYSVLLLAVLFVYDFTFLNVMIFNMFTVLFFFLARFNYVLYKSKKKLTNEK